MRPASFAAFIPCIAAFEAMVLPLSAAWTGFEGVSAIGVPNESCQPHPGIEAERFSIGA
jgi:hypothetical protein